MSEHKNVYAAKLAVMQEVPYVLKEKPNGLNYAIASEAAFIELLHPALVKHGLTIAPIDAACVDHSGFVAKDGKPWHRLLLRLVYRLMHADSGTHEDIVVISEASDVGDKSAAKAMTIGMKYAIRQAFYVETGTDPDRCPSEEQEQAPAQQPSKPSVNGHKPQGNGTSGHVQNPQRNGTGTAAAKNPADSMQAREAMVDCIAVCKQPSDLAELSKDPEFNAYKEAMTEQDYKIVKQHWADAVKRLNALAATPVG